MTNDFKEQLLRYLTGKINIQSGNNEPQFNAPINIANNLYSYIMDNAVSPLASSYKLIRGKNTNNQYIDNYLLIGLDSDDNSSFMIILNQGFNPMKFINTYSSGTRFGAFEEVIIDDDGRFYAVEYVNGTGVRRFVMMNNILMKASNQLDYKVVLRQSYNLPNSLQTGTIEKLIKKPLGNKYLFCASTSSNYPLVVEFTINVGESNDWIEYTNTDHNCSIEGAWASWDEDDNLQYKVICSYTNGVNGYLYLFYNLNDTMTLLNQYNLPDPTADWIQANILNDTTIYLSYCASDENAVYNQYIYSVDTTLNLIFVSNNEDVAMPGYLINSTLYNDGLNVFISYNLPKADNSIEYHMGIIYQGIVYDYNFGALDYTTSQNLFVTNTYHQFNLYSYYLQLGDVCYVVNSIFNNLEYNGLPYTSINSLSPNSAILYASYHIPIFARNLYNKVINNNTTVATIEIPNTMLNLVNIQEQSLLGETNLELVNNQDLIVTNEYETLDINFYNTLIMRNENDLDNIIINRVGASRINNSISRQIDYLSAMATKARVNYSDNTSMILTIDPTTQITITNEIATYNFNVFCPAGKTINNIEIISEDEATSYTTITGTFQSNKLYTITEDVYIV